MTPSEKTSLRASTVSPRICSGLMYAGVPNAASASLFGVRTSGSSALGRRSRCAIPKSTSFTSPRFETSTFAGFTSRCTTPRSCAWASAARDLEPDCRRELGREAGALAEDRRQAEPVDQLEDEPHLRLRLHEVVQHHDVRVARASPSTRASRSSCAANGDVGAIVLFSALIATTRPSGSCTARYTVESEPDPSSSRTRYGPKARLRHGLLSRSECPVIAAGWGMPSSSSIVGATSQMRPPGVELRAAVGVVHVEERDGVRRVRGVRLARRRVLHQLAVAVVGRDEDRAPLRARRVDDLAERERRPSRPP